MKSYILFAFGEYLPESKSIDLIVQFVSQISKKDVRFQHGQSGVIVTFESNLDIHKITKYFEENIFIALEDRENPAGVDAWKPLDDQSSYVAFILSNLVSLLGGWTGISNNILPT